MMALTAINLAYYQELMAGARAAIEAGQARRIHRRDARGVAARRKLRRLK